MSTFCWCPFFILVLIKVEDLFQQWGLDFIGEIHPPSSAQHKWILNAIAYFSKWVEAIPTKFSTNPVVIKFLGENIITRFGCPRKLITDNAQAFKSLDMIDFYQKNNIILVHSTSCYPQGNGLVESSNKGLIRIIKKILTNKKRAWNSHLKYALWENKISTKKATCMSPFQFIYGIDVVLTINLALPLMKLLQDFEEEPNDITEKDESINLSTTKHGTSE
jgi:hypothetical protein